MSLRVLIICQVQLVQKMIVDITTEMKNFVLNCSVLPKLTAGLTPLIHSSSPGTNALIILFFGGEERGLSYIKKF